MLQLRNEFAKCGATPRGPLYANTSRVRVRTPQSQKRAKGEKEIESREKEGEMDDKKSSEEGRDLNAPID